MKKNMFFITALVMSQAYANECASNEILIASCTLSGKVERIAAFCANLKDDTVKYRFTKGGETELVVGFNHQNKLRRWVDLGTYTTYLGFSRSDYSYILSVPEEKPGVVAQLDVKKNNKIIISKQCDFNSFGEERLKMNSIEDIPDNLVRDSGFKFP